MAKAGNKREKTASLSKKTLPGLLVAASQGRKGLARLDKAIRKAGYLPAAEALTQKDVDVAFARFERLVEGLAPDGMTKQEWLKRVQEAVAAVDAGR